jgi:hypothetical protein
MLPLHLLLALGPQVSVPPAPDTGAGKLVQPALRVAAQALVRRAGGDILLLVSPEGDVRSLGSALTSGTAPAPEVLSPELRGSLRLPDPARSLLALGCYAFEPRASGEDLAPDPRQRCDVLFLCSPAGLEAFALEADGSISATGRRLARRASFGLRVGTPRFAPLLDDVNADGLSDFLVPSPKHVALWLQRGEPGQEPVFELAGEVAVEVGEGAGFDGEDLTDRLSLAFTIPGIETEDVNGDKRPDLLVAQGQRRGFHLQRDDGSYPKEPDIELDLSIFRDPEFGDFELQPGGSLTLGENASMTRSDLDADGIPDHVISQGKKLWVFRGTTAGPQFTQPSTVLKSAEAITGVLTPNLDEDKLRDMLLMRVEVPTIPTLMLGLFSSWDISVRASGYRNLGAARFETKPFRSTELKLRLPPILELVRDPYSLVERFRRAGSQFRERTGGDFDGDGNPDILLLSPERDRAELYLGRGPEAGHFTLDDFEATLRRELFETDRQVWDIDRLLGFLGGLAAEQERRLTEGQEPKANYPLDAKALGLPKASTLIEVISLDLDGDGRDSAIAVWALGGDSQQRGYQLLR